MGVTVLALGMGARLHELLAAALGAETELRLVTVGDERWCQALRDRVLDALIVAESATGTDDADGIAELRRSLPTAALVMLADGPTGDRGLDTLGCDEVVSAAAAPAELANAIRRAILERRDRFRWPRSFAERRALAVAPMTSEPVRAAIAALEGVGYEVTRVADAAEAMAQLRREEAQVALVDGTGDETGGVPLVRAIAGFDGRVATLAIAGDADGVHELLLAGALAAVVGWPAERELLALVDGGWHAWAAHAPAMATRRRWQVEPLRALVGVPSPEGGALAEVLSADRPAWAVTVAGDRETIRSALQGEAYDLVLLDEAGCLAVCDLLAARRTAHGGPAVVAMLAAEADGSVVARLADDVVAAGSPSGSTHQLVLRLEGALDRVAVDGRLAVLVQRLHEVDARRVELIRKLADVHLELERMATVDSVTEILNRRGVQAALSRELDVAQRTGGSVAACYVDCDDFRRVNEQFGHGVGDAVLRSVAARLNSALRRTDSIGRVGGDEFLMLLPQTRIAEALLVAERARVAVAAEPFGLADDPVRLSVSMGVAVLPWDARSLDEVLPLTRMALEQTKRCESGGSVAASSDSLASAITQLTGDLVSGEGLRAVVQPIVRVSDERTVGHELLTRAREGLFEEPEQFLRVARDRGVLTAVDLQCLKVCMAYAESLPTDLQVHVNLFPTTLLDVPTEQLVDLLQLEGGMQLCVELSEEQFVGDPRDLLDRLAALRSSGLRLAVDDVGKGRGTLDSVMLLEPDVVKIDQELISGAYRDVRKERLLRRLVVLADALNCEVVGEGVEDPEDLALLRELGVPYAQGYLWSRPRELEQAD